VVADPLFFNDGSRLMATLAKKGRNAVQHILLIAAVPIERDRPAECEGQIPQRFVVRHATTSGTHARGIVRVGRCIRIGFANRFAPFTYPHGSAKPSSHAPSLRNQCVRRLTLAPVFFSHAYASPSLTTERIAGSGRLPLLSPAALRSCSAR
jgi:hypothetical protein